MGDLVLAGRRPDAQPVWRYSVRKLPTKKFLIAQTQTDVPALARTYIPRNRWMPPQGLVAGDQMGNGHELQPAALSASYSAVGPGSLFRTTGYQIPGTARLG